MMLNVFYDDHCQILLNDDQVVPQQIDPSMVM